MTITTLNETLLRMEYEERLQKLEEQSAALKEQLDYYESRDEELEAALETAYYIIKEEAPSHLAELRRLEPIVRKLFPK